MEEKVRPDEAWEQATLEQLVEESSKLVLLDITQDAAIKLASTLGDVRHALEFDDPDPDENVGNILRKVGRLAVLLDALQLLYGDAVEEEIAFLQEIENAIE